MNKAIATRLTRLERVITPTKMNVLLVHGTGRATWPKPGPGCSAIYVPIKDGVPYVGDGERCGRR
jgi:hypothetical protein